MFADELQILARKVISKKPDFWENLDTTLKQWYTGQLYDHNSASIAKTLLIQMPKVSFTEFHNELARVLGTHQWAITKASSKAAVEVNETQETVQSKPKVKHHKKISMQSSQIKDL